MEIGIQDLLGSTPSADSITNYLSYISRKISAVDALVPEVKAYPDMVYFNYYKLGISFQFAPREGYKPATGLKRNELRDDRLSLECIDVYNGTWASPSNETSPRTTQPTFSSYPSFPLQIPLEASSGNKESRPPFISIATNTTGKEFVSWLGEPSRKGGGVGPSSGSINIWCEWSRDGIMVEFGGEEARGPRAWERGKDAMWKVITLFLSKDG
ncbi:hypothetical protein ID866_1172 [Astraeus odoratus]|nr:hypothetical protein ID866_1172 [Astraeus odoratus]